jgi:hypothetical protein
MIDMATSARSMTCINDRCCRDVVARGAPSIGPRDQLRADERHEGITIMCRNPNRGRVYRRCACRDTAGKQLGPRCPDLTNRRHGRWAFAVDLPTIDGQRKTLRRCGFPTQNQARTALRRVLVCEQAGIHDLHVRVINTATGDLLRKLTIDTDRDYQPRQPKTPKTATAEPTHP